MTEKKQREPEVADIFQCTRCGYCCHGETTVSLDEMDQERMVAKLGLNREEVTSRYWRVTGDIIQMKTVDGHCIFYAEGQGCTVHEGRPWRCGQWPLHPSILSDRNNFETIKESCPGISRGKEYDDFCVILRVLLDHQKKLSF